MDELLIAQITALTHKGRVRATNEDCVAVNSWVRNKSMTTPHQWRLALEQTNCCVVADGMGGHAAGEIASLHVASRLSEAFCQPSDLEDVSNILSAVNIELYDQMKVDSARTGMGSTVVGVVFDLYNFHWFNVGDSKLFQYRNGFLRQISIDDTADFVSTPGSAPQNRSGMITQSFGGTDSHLELSPHFGTLATSSSRWLLCSDGLTDMVSIDMMEECMDALDLEAAERLVESAMRSGAEDNISFIIISLDKVQ